MKPMTRSQIQRAPDEVLLRRLDELAGMADDSSPEYNDIQHDMRRRARVREFANASPSPLGKPEEPTFVRALWGLALVCAIGVILLVILRAVR